MTPKLETLLAVIGTAWQADKPYPVRKLLIREELGSTATIHKRIHQLKDAGFVSFDTLTSSETKTLSPNKTPQPPMMPGAVYDCVGPTDAPSSATWSFRQPNRERLPLLLQSSLPRFVLT